jgi:hypothetical protein
MRRFFLALGVRVQVVPGPLPDVVQPVQDPAQGVLGHPLPGGPLQGLAEQGHRPTDVRVTEVLGRGGEEVFQRLLVVLTQRGVTPPPSGALKGRGVVALEVSPDPVVDALSGHPEHAGDVGGGAPVVELQDGEGTPKEAGIPGLRELTAEPLPLPGGQFEPAHGPLLDRGETQEQTACHIDSAGLLRRSAATRLNGSHP